MADTVVLGAGIIGLSTAYYLSEHQPGSSIHLVESSPELFASASGYAGGFLARDWFGPATASLGALSFDEHRRLAEAHGGREKWGYSPSSTISYTPAPATADRAAKGRRGEDWLREGTSRSNAAVSVVDDKGGSVPDWLRWDSGDELEVIGGEGTTAQVDPLRLCRFILQECLARGVRLHHPARAVSAVMANERDDPVAEGGELASVLITSLATTTTTEVRCTRVVIAAGCWSPRVFAALFPRSAYRLPVASLAGHSLVVRSPRWRGGADAPGCHAVFASSAGGGGGDGFAPEVFSRLGGEVYVAGLNSASLPLPEVATARRVQPEAVAALRAVTGRMLGPRGGGAEDDDGWEVLREGLCFRPVTPAGVPIVARVPDGHLGAAARTRPGAGGGVYVAAGHGPWGISQGLGTGRVLAEMAQGRELSADVSGLALQ